MDRFPGAESSILRARWLAELADALDRARVIVADLGQAELQIDTADLYDRIECVRAAVLAMRVRPSLSSFREFTPEWSESLPWSHGA